MKKKKWIKYILFVLITLFCTPFLIYFFTPDINLFHPNEIIYKNNNDEKIYSTIQNKSGNYISIENVSDSFLNYLIAIEDKDFFSHKGFDFSRIISSFLHNISGSSLQGASTITMQLARMLYLNNDQSIERKIQELAIAIKLEKQLTKKQILEYYLNNIYFAHGIYGIGNATKYYFEKTPNEINLKESAILIAIINAPNIYSPYIDYEACNNKVESILRTLHNRGLITIKDYYNALYEPIILKEHSAISVNPYSYYIDSINEEFKKINASKNFNIKHGVEITSYLDENLQTYIENLVSKINFENSDIAICIMEVGSGKVISLLGGKDYLTSSFNRALHAKKQIGSTIKPLLYYLALKKGLSPFLEFESKKTIFKLNEEEFYEVKNANDIYANRKISMVEAIAMSDNIYAMKTMLLVKKENLINLIKRFDYEVDVNNVTLALGSNSLTPLELTSIYNAIASDGIYYTPHFIKNIKYDENTTIYKDSNANKRVFHNETNTILQYLLRAPFDSSLKSYGSPSLMNYYVSNSYGAKTGSTENSSWVMGFSKNYTIGIYLGSDDNTPISNAYLSRVLFYEIATYLDNKKGEYFSIPSSLKKFNLLNTITNKRSFTYVY